MSEFDAMAPVPEVVKLVDANLEVKLEELRTRQFFLLLRVITTGVPISILRAEAMQMRGIESPEVFAAKFGVLIFTALTEAQEEMLTFLRSMCRPIGMIKRPKDDYEQSRNAALYAEIDEALANPTLDDLLTLVDAIVKRSAPNLTALGKRLAAMWKVAEKAGLVKPTPSATPAESSEASPDAST